MKIIIPARRGSKGLPFKNRKLLEHTLDIIPHDIEVAVLTDDEEIFNRCKSYPHPNITPIWRSPEVSLDTTSTKETVTWGLNKLIDWDHEDIVMLYLTYPQRTWKHVEDAYGFYKSSNAESMLCKKEIDQSPFLMLKEEGGNRGSQLFYHDMYRRQDYPKCFEISHFISVFRASTINKLNNNMYNNDTVFYPIDHVIDIDEKKDLDQFLNGE